MRTQRHSFQWHMRMRRLIDVERQVVVGSYEPQCFKVDGGISGCLAEILPGS